jgi:hypothetical protein
MKHCILILSFLPLIACGPESSPTSITQKESGNKAKSSYPADPIRWRDVLDNKYGQSLIDRFSYDDSTFDISHSNNTESFFIHIHATGLKPNFAYDLKLQGKPEHPSNDLIRPLGRIWQERWDGEKWTDGDNLNNKGNGDKISPNDKAFAKNSKVEDPTSPTGKKYRYTNYIVFDYFVTDWKGNAVIETELKSSFHVLWKSSQRKRTERDGDIREFDISAEDSKNIYSKTLKAETVELFAEWERLPVDGIRLPKASYDVDLIVTEESFHGKAPYSGKWASVLSFPLEFEITAPE